MRLPRSMGSPSTGFSDGVRRGTGVIQECAINAVRTRCFNDMGIVKYLPFFKQALVVLPGDACPMWAESPSVMQVVCGALLPACGGG